MGIPICQASKLYRHCLNETNRCCVLSVVPSAAEAVQGHHSAILIHCNYKIVCSTIIPQMPDAELFLYQGFENLFEIPHKINPLH